MSPQQMWFEIHRLRREEPSRAQALLTLFALRREQARDDLETSDNPVARGRAQAYAELLGLFGEADAMVESQQIRERA